MSRKELALSIGVTSEMIERMEHGDEPMDLSRILSVAWVMGLDPPDLLPQEWDEDIECAGPRTVS